MMMCSGKDERWVYMCKAVSASTVIILEDIKLPDIGMTLSHASSTDKSTAPNSRHSLRS